MRASPMDDGQLGPKLTMGHKAPREKGGVAAEDIKANRFDLV